MLVIQACEISIPLFGRSKMRIFHNMKLFGISPTICLNMSDFVDSSLAWSPLCLKGSIP